MEKLLLPVLCFIVVCAHARPRMPEKETKSTAKEASRELSAAIDTDNLNVAGRDNAKRWRKWGSNHNGNHGNHGNHGQNHQHNSGWKRALP